MKQDSIVEGSKGKIIQACIALHLVKAGHEAVCENFGHLFEMDVASLSKSGMLHEFEVKVSRSDFLRDKNKGCGLKKFDRYEDSERNHFRCPNYFFYVCPDGLISPSEIPLYAGLYYFADNQVWLKKKAKKIHNVPAEIEKVLAKMLRMNVQRKYLGGTMLTYKNNLLKERYNTHQ